MEKLVQKYSFLRELQPFFDKSLQNCSCFRRKTSNPELDKKFLHFCIYFAIYAENPQKNGTFAGICTWGP